MSGGTSGGVGGRSSHLDRSYSPHLSSGILSKNLVDCRKEEPEEVVTEDIITPLGLQEGWR